MNDELIKEALHAYHGVEDRGQSWAWSEESVESMRAAFAVFEKAHTPTDDERETLAFTLFLIESGQDEDWLRGVWANHPSEHPVKVGYYRQADAILATGFHRTEVPEPSADGTPRDFEAYELTVDMLEDLLVTAGVSTSEHGIAIRKTAGALVFKIGARLTAEPQGEPSDAQVHAGWVAINGVITQGQMRAALRAAGNAR